jgi:hypothetical protein
VPFIPIRAWLGLAVALALAAGGVWAYQTGYKAGSAAIQSEWDKNAAIREKFHREALMRSEDLLNASRKITQEVEQNLTARLSAADSRGRDLAGRLRLALAGAGTCPVSPAGVAAGAIDRGSGEPDNQGEIGTALADHLAACERDAQRLTDLQTWVGRIQREVVIPDASREL